MKDEKDEVGMPEKHNTEDSIYNECVMGIEEFPQYITHYNDIVHRGHTRVSSEALKNLQMDSVYERENGSLVNIEHHSTLDEEKLARNLEYITTLHHATLKKVEQFIMYTGRLPVKKTVNLNYKDTYSPNFFISKFQNGESSLNNLKYKLQNNKKITPFDVIDLIWLPSFDIDDNKDDLVVELSEIYNQIDISNSLSRVVRRCLIMWAGKHVKKPENQKIVEEKLEMSAIHIRTLEEEIRNAKIDGMITRAEEKGIKIGEKNGEKNGEKRGIKIGEKNGEKRGIKIGEKNGEKRGIKIGEKNGARKKEEEIIKTLLKTQDAEKIAEMLECDIKKIQEIENNTKNTREH